MASILAIILLSASVTISYANADTGKKKIASFVDPKKDPQSYVKRYQNEQKYKEWFDKNYGSKYKSIYEAVGLPEPKKQLGQKNIEQQKNIEILIKKANAYAVYEWYDKSQKYYDEALKLDPNNQEAKKNKDQTYKMKKSIGSTDYLQLIYAHRINDAKKACDKTEEYNVNECKWLVAMELGNYNDAEKYVEKMRSDLDNGNYLDYAYQEMDVNYVLPKESATLYKQKRYDDLISYLNERIKFSYRMGIDNTSELITASLVYEKMNNYEGVSASKNTFNNDCNVQMYGINYAKALYYNGLYDYEKAKFYADKLPDDKFYDQRNVDGCTYYGNLIDNRFYAFKLHIEASYNQQKNRDFGG